MTPAFAAAILRTLGGVSAGSESMQLTTLAFAFAFAIFSVSTLSAPITLSTFTT